MKPCFPAFSPNQKVKSWSYTCNAFTGSNRTEDRTSLFFLVKPCLHWASDVSDFLLFPPIIQKPITVIPNFQILSTQSIPQNFLVCIKSEPFPSGHKDKPLTFFSWFVSDPDHLLQAIQTGNRYSNLWVCHKFISVTDDLHNEAYLCHPVILAFISCASSGPLGNTSVFAWEETCKPFHEIYADGTELCEKMWDDSFKVVPGGEPSYTMWFFHTDHNPNDEVTLKLFSDEDLPNVCHLDSKHKEVPSPEDDAMSECHPWKKHSCCDSATVKSADALKQLNGPGYEWDRCGPMSDACQRFFVQEACLYQCDPNAGKFLKIKDPNAEGYNGRQLHQMPIKRSYCDSWYEACRNDYFCGSGSFFECEAFYWERLEEKKFEDGVVDRALKIGLSLAGVIGLVGIGFSIFLIRKERDGDPVFGSENDIVSA